MNYEMFHIEFMVACTQVIIVVYVVTIILRLIILLLRSLSTLLFIRLKI